MISLTCASSSVTVKVRAIGFGNNVVALRPEETTVVGEVLLQEFFDRRISVLFERDVGHEILGEEVADRRDGLVDDFRGSLLLCPVGVVGPWSRPDSDDDIFEDTLGGASGTCKQVLHAVFFLRSSSDDSQQTPMLALGRTFRHFILVGGVGSLAVQHSQHAHLRAKPCSLDVVGAIVFEELDGTLVLNSCRSVHD